jgi:molecular chaperone DnaK
MYAVGIDIGTTHTAAAVWRDGHAEIAPLGSHSAAIPSVLLLRADGSFLVGESAVRRGLVEPGRVAREFKRRLGDTGPILLGGTPFSAAALTAKMLRSVLDAVAAREGGPPAAICVAHPANWGPYKMDLLRQVVRLADIEQPVQYITDPQAAASHHVRRQPLEPGAVVAVYDLGGGTFDAAVLRLTADGFDLIGEPKGIERLGGADFDTTIFDYVAASVGAPLEQLDKADPAVIAATARLRDECVQAKESLSADTDAAIQVLLPTVSTEVGLTRAELEAMIRPALQESVEALRREIRSAGFAPRVLSEVLLMGGSSRMPVVAQMVGADLERTVTVDANPKHAVALGAAWQAGNTLAGRKPVPVPAPVSVPPPPVDPWESGTPAPPAAPAEAQVVEEPTDEIPIVAVPAADDDRPPLPKATVTARAAVGATTETSQAAATAGAGQAAAAAGAGPAVSPPVWPPAQPANGAKRRAPALVAGALAVLLLASAGSVWALTSSGEDEPAAQPAQVPRQSQVAAGASAAAPSQQASVAPVPADEQCTEQMKKSKRWVCLTKATLRGNTFTVWYDAEWNGTPPDKRRGFHLHVYGGDGTHPDEATMGSQAVVHSKYYFEDEQPSVVKTSDSDFDAVGDADKVCARIAQSGHGLAKAADGGYHTGNCIPIQRE